MFLSNKVAIKKNASKHFLIFYQMNRSFKKPTYSDAIAKIKDLHSSDRPYFRDVYGYLVSMEAGSPSRLFITDFTTNPSVYNSNYTIDSKIGNTNDDIDKDSILKIYVYVEKLTPLMIEIKKNRGFDATDLKVNVTELGIFVKCKLKVRHNGIIDTTAQYLTFLNEFDPSNEIFEKTIKSLPSSFVLDNKSNFTKIIPESYINKWLGNNPLSDIFQTPSTPTVQNGFNSSLTSLPNYSLMKSSVPDNYTPAPMRSSLPGRQLPQEPNKKKQKITSDHIRRLNSMEQIDGKIFNVIGTIVEIEPLFNQFCIKKDINCTPELVPITIILKGNMSNDPNELDESNFLRISIIEKSQILRFFGMKEIEEVYIKSNEIYSKFSFILKQKKQIEVNVLRRLIKINDIGSTILGWELNDMTLDNLI